MQPNFNTEQSFNLNDSMIEKSENASKPLTNLNVGPSYKQQSTNITNKNIQQQELQREFKFQNQQFQQSFTPIVDNQQIQQQQLQYSNNLFGDNININRQQQNAKVNFNQAKVEMIEEINVSSSSTLDRDIPVSQMDAMQKLRQFPGIFVKQKFQILEVVTGCELENKYHVYAADKLGECIKKQSLFVCKEKSGWYERQCLSGSCRPFKIRVSHDSEGQSNKNGQLCFQFIRSCKCTLFCCNRPIMEVQYIEGDKDKNIGFVYSPFTLCNYELHVKDAYGNLLYYIIADCCQCGIYCRMCPCSKCQNIFFNILDSKHDVVGSLTKRTKGCIVSLVSDADNFSLIFPPQSKAEERALLMASVIFLDFTYFEEKPQKEEGIVQLK